MRRVSILLLSFFVLTYCTTELNIVPDGHNSPIVLNSLFHPDSTWTVELTRAVGIVNPNPSTMNNPLNAQVTISDENGPIETLKMSFNKFFIPEYRGTTRPVIGKKYFINVSTSDGTKMLAENQIPPPVEIVMVETDSALFKSNGEDVRMKLQLKDPGDKKNYYQVRIIHTLVFRSTVNNEPVEELIEDGVYFEPIDPALESSFVVKRGTVFSDELFNGQLFEINLKVKRSGYYSLPVRSVRVELLSTSEEYYMYFNSKYLQEESANDPFTQPVQIFTNVDGGIGVFAGFSSSIWKLK